MRLKTKSNHILVSDHLGQIFSSSQSSIDKGGGSWFIPKSLLVFCNFSIKKDYNQDLLWEELFHEQSHYNLLLRIASINLALYMELLAILRFFELLVNRKDKTSLCIHTSELPEILLSDRLFPKAEEVLPYKIFNEGLALIYTIFLEREYVPTREERLIKALWSYRNHSNFIHYRAIRYFAEIRNKLQGEVEFSPFDLIGVHNLLCAKVLEDLDCQDEILELDPSSKTLSKLRKMFSSTLDKLLWELEKDSLYLGQTITQLHQDGSIWTNTWEFWRPFFRSLWQSIAHRGESLPEEISALFLSSTYVLTSALDLNFILYEQYPPSPLVRTLSSNQLYLSDEIQDFLNSFGGKMTMYVPTIFKDGFHLPIYSKWVPSSSGADEKILNYLKAWLLFSIFKAAEDWVKGKGKLECPFYGSSKDMLGSCPIFPKGIFSENFCVHTGNKTYIKDLGKQDCLFWNTIQKMFSFYKKIELRTE